MIRCPTRKVTYASSSLAEDALIDAWIRNNHKVGSGPVNVYVCEDCGNFHFTSKGAMSNRLKTELDSGSITRSQRAFELEAKLRRR